MIIQDNAIVIRYMQWIEVLSLIIIILDLCTNFLFLQSEEFCSTVTMPCLS